MALVIGVAAVVALGLLVAGSGGDGEPRIVSDEERAANVRRAQFIVEFADVCEAGAISNAADFEKPYRVVAFTERYDGGEYSELTMYGAPDFVVQDSFAVSSVNVVACFTRKRGTEVRSGSCEFDSGNEVPRFAVEYDMVVHEAKSGKVIEDLGTVRGPANDCPMLALFNKGSPKIYGSPDKDEVIEKLAGFVDSR